MAECYRNGIASLAVDRVPSSTASVGHSRLWAAFSGSAFRRKFFDAVSCGGSSRHRHYRYDYNDDDTITAIAEMSSPKVYEEKPPEEAKTVNVKSDKLSDLLSLSESSEAEADVETKKKEDALEELKQVVKDLQVEDLTKRKVAASKVRLLAKDDLEARGTLAMLGAIPPLVGMLNLGDNESQIASLYALLNLGIGNNVNKAAIVKAGVIHKMLTLIGSGNAVDPSVSEAIIANFLALSALDSNKPIIGPSGAIPFLVKNLQNLQNRSNYIKKMNEKRSSQAMQDALRALYNLSIFAPNISFIFETNFIPFCLNMLGDMEVSERLLSILSTVVAVPEGLKTISIVPDALPILVDVLNWTDSPGCQEKASYILMVMAHTSYGDRQAMIEAGIVSAALELTLLGSTLAQKRASRILACLRVGKGKQISDNFCGNLGPAVSAPIHGTLSSSNPSLGSNEYLEELEDMMSEETKAVKQLVQQSLQNNMRRIVTRANLPEDFVPSEHFKSLISTSNSKSLPF